MSIHYHKPNYQCPRCQSLFLPYKIGIECPKCGVVVDDADTTEYLDIIESIAESMEIHKKKYGRYFPDGWSMIDFMDHLQNMIFTLFDSMEEAKPANEKQYLIKVIDNKDNWENQQYLSAYFKSIVFEVFKIYKAKHFSEIKLSEPRYDYHLRSDEIEPERPYTKWEKMKKWFGKFLS